MIIIVHSETHAGNVKARLGEAEYSYYFVLKEYRRVLDKLGVVVAVVDPRHEVDKVYHSAKAHGQACIFLSFAPPHQTLLDLQCPTFSVFAWEFETIPNEIWDEEPRNDWRSVFKQMGHAITHSDFVVRAVRGVMGPAFPVVSIPAPVWDRFDVLYRHDEIYPVDGSANLRVTGTIVDTAVANFDYAGKRLPEPVPDDAPSSLTLSGVIYCSVFNPQDGRKNWHDMLCGFCLTFRDNDDATLIFKLTHHDRAVAFEHMLETIYRLTPFKCRVILIHGYLDDIEFKKLVSATKFVVNASAGEGQCLPLMEFMSAGKPAIAPWNTAQLDYLDAGNSFPVESSLEPWCWPHDSRQAFRTMRHRIDFDSLTAAYRKSYEVVKNDPTRYRQMAAQANRGLQDHCSEAVAESRLRKFLSDNLKDYGGSELLNDVTELAG